MRNVKIVVVGIGSASFGPKTLGDIFTRPELAGSELWLVDINPDALEWMGRLAQKLNEQWSCGLSVHQTTDLSQALPDADFVICMLEASRDQLWQLDMQIPHKYGVMQVLGENGGPGGLSHTLRTAPLVLAVAQQMEQYCPQAWLLNYTNPVPRICRAISKYSNIKAIGFCHGIGGTIKTIGQILEVEPEALDVKAAGLNHFHWVLDVRLQESGEDLYEALRQREPEFEPEQRHLWRDLFRRLGYFPFPSDDHIGEYLPFMHVREFGSWEKYGHDHALLHWDGEGDRRGDMWGRIRQLVGGEESIESLRQGSGERAINVLLAIRDNLNSYELALNIPNKGYITNLPDGCTVEVPASVSGFGVDGLTVGDLPASVAGLCNTQAYVAELAVDAAVKGERAIALQALLADPVVNDIDVAEKILDEYLSVHAAWLPQFAN
jgi:alpha-galactosidase